MNPDCPDCRATARQNADRQKRVRDKRRAVKATLKDVPESATTHELREALERSLVEVTNNSAPDLAKRKIK